MAAQAQIFTKQLDLSGWVARSLIHSLIHLLTPMQHYSSSLNTVGLLGRMTTCAKKNICFALFYPALSISAKRLFYSILIYSVLFDFNLIPASVHDDASSSLSILATKSLSSRGRGEIEAGSSSNPPSVSTVAIAVAAAAASVLDLARIS